MKKMILATLMSATVTAAHAEGHVCAAIGELAEVIMSVRQNGVPMSTAMAKLVEVDPSVREATSHLVRMAYDEPLYSSETYQRRAVIEFRDNIEVLCFNSNLGL